MPPKPKTTSVAAAAAAALAVAAQVEPKATPGALVATPDAVQAEPAALVEPAAAAFTHRITAAVEKGFYRAGRYWPRDGVDVNRDAFDEAQWSALEGEPMLTVKPL